MRCSNTLQGRASLDFRDFTFLDLGSGKGRTLLMASDYAFRKIVGVELLQSLHQIAQENLLKYKSDSQKCFVLESVCADATDFPLPDGGLVVYLSIHSGVGHATSGGKSGAEFARQFKASVRALSQRAAGACAERERDAAEDWGAPEYSVFNPSVVRRKRSNTCVLIRVARGFSGNSL